MKNKFKKIIKYATFILIPFIIVFLTFFIKIYSGPYWLGSNSDPEYAYLFNSLNIVNRIGIGHIDHPGTTLQIFGAIVLFIVNFFRGSTDITNDVLTNPEIYLNIINWSLVFILVAVTFVGGILIYKFTKKIYYGWIYQLTPLLSLTSIYLFNRISPDLVLLEVGMLLSLIVLLSFYKKLENNILFVVIVSILTGFSLATKINSLPIMLVGLIYLNFKNKLIYFFGSILSFIVFTIPIRSQYSQFFNWVNNLMTHDGRYGGGNQRIVDIDLFLNNFIAIITVEKIFTLVLILIFIFLIYSYVKDKKNNFTLLLIGILVFFFVQIVLVSKHFAFHYMAPALSYIGIAYISVNIYISSKYSIKVLFKRIIDLMIFTLLIIVSISNVIKTYKMTNNLNVDYLEANKFTNFYDKNADVVVYYYRSSSKEFALKFGNEYARNAYADQLIIIYPNILFYNIWNGEITNWTNKVSLPNDSNVYFQGTPFRDDYLIYHPKYKLEEKYGSKYESIYLVSFPHE